MPSLSSRRARIHALALSFAAAATLTLACHGGDSTAPAPEPTRLPIVYSLAQALTPEHDLFLLSADGKTSQPFPSMRGDKVNPTWSPDGHSLAFVWLGVGSGAYVANEDGANPILLPPMDLGGVRWSPDGSWLLFANDNPLSGNTEIVQMHVDGSGRRAITTGIDDVFNSPPSWSRDGRIAFMRKGTNRNGDGRIWSMKLDGSELVQLTSGVRDDRPLWSPDARLLAYTAGGPTPTSGSIYRYQIAVVNADGSGNRVLTGADGSTENYLSAWSPDGQWLLFHRWGQLEPGVYGCAYYKVAVSGGAAVRVSPIGAYCGGATWR